MNSKKDGKILLETLTKNGKTLEKSSIFNELDENAFDNLDIISTTKDCRSNELMPATTTKCEKCKWIDNTFQRFRVLVASLTAATAAWVAVWFFAWFGIYALEAAMPAVIYNVVLPLSWLTALVISVIGIAFLVITDGNN